MHPRSLISVFVVRCLDSIIPGLAKSKVFTKTKPPENQMSQSREKTCFCHMRPTKTESDQCLCCSLLR